VHIKVERLVKLNAPISHCFVTLCSLARWVNCVRIVNWLAEIAINKKNFVRQVNCSIQNCLDIDWKLIKIKVKFDAIFIQGLVELICQGIQLDADTVNCLYMVYGIWYIFFSFIILIYNFKYLYIYFIYNTQHIQIFIWLHKYIHT